MDSGAFDKPITFPIKHIAQIRNLPYVWWKRVTQLDSKKSVDELLEEIATNNVELFELLATNGNFR